MVIEVYNPVFNFRHYYQLSKAVKPENEYDKKYTSYEL